MPRNFDNADSDLPLEVTRQIDALCDEFEAALKLGADVCLEQYAARVDPRGRNRLLEELSFLALERLRKTAKSDPREEFLNANPSVRDELVGLLTEADGAATVSTDYHQGSRGKVSGLAIRCPHCHSMMELIVDASLMEITCSSCGDTFSLIDDAQDTRDKAAVTRVAHFELIERLGMGQFGTVWKARDTMLERTVAIKIPRREQLDSLSVEKFMREARAAAQLQHPNIVSTHEVGRHGDTLYIVSEYIRAVPLSEMISDSRLGIRESMLMVTKIADALEHAHLAGVVHRDIKPSNVLVDDHGEPHLMDFGLAKRGENEITMTTDGAIVGTPAYMSPEQARGEANRVDGRSDIYSLGVILFQLLTGELPFRGSTRMLLQKVINDDPPGPRTLDSHVPRDVDTICLKCLEKEPSRRYGTAGELAADLRRFVAGQPVAARRIGRLGRAVRWARRNPAVSLLLAATITTLLSASVISTYFAWRAEKSAARADQQAMAVTNTLYDSLLQEIRLTREVRNQGYGEKVRQLVDRARNLDTTRVDKDELRRQLVLSMGDFVAYSPRVIAPLKGQVTAFRLSNDGREIFVGQSNGSLAIYDVDTGNARGELEALGGSVISVAITARGDGLVAADQTGTVRLWRRVDQKWKMERNFQLGEAPQTVFFSADGERVAYLKDTLLEVWDVAAGAKLWSLPTKPDWLMRNGKFDATRERLVAGYVNNQADTVGWAQWKLGTGERSEFDIPGLGETYPNAIDLATAGDRLAIGFDEALVIFGMTDSQHTILSRFDSTIAVAFSPTNPYFAAANIRGRITVWNSAANRQLATLQLPTPSPSFIRLAFSADGGRLVASNAERIQVWDLTRADETTVMTGHNGAIPCAAFSPDGRLLATGGKDKVVRFWNPSTGQPVQTLPLGEKVQALAFSPDGRLLTVGCMGTIGAANLRMVDVKSMKSVYESKPEMGEVLSLAWSEVPDGRYLAGCGQHGLALWKVAQGLPVRMETVLELDRGRCLATVLHREAGVLVWAEEENQENRLKAWDFSARKMASLNAPEMNQGWHGVALLPDGQSIIYISKSGVAEVWNVKRNRRIHSVGKPGTFGAPELALSPNGIWLAALTQLDTVSVWHMPTGKHVFTLRPESGAVWSLAWDPSSEHLAVGQSDGGLAIWHLAKIQEKLTESGLPWKDDD